MRQFSFLILFLVLMAIALFSMQNSHLVAITLAPGITFESPLSVELLVAAGIGAIFAWMYGVWMKMQMSVETFMKTREKDRELQEKQAYINELQKMLDELQTAVKQLPPTKRAEAKEESESGSGAQPQGVLGSSSGA